MSPFIRVVLLLVFIPLLLFSQEFPKFSDYFENKTMRIDYYHVGDAKRELITIDHIYQQGIWAGSLHHLIDRFNNGRYYIKIYDTATDRLIFSRGFNSYFGEYQTSTPGIEGINRTYHETALIPYPKNKIRFTVEKRDSVNVLHLIFSREIDPESVSIITEPPGKGVKVYEIINNGDPHQKADIVFIAEGYTAHEEMKVKSDLDKYARELFSVEPYKSMKNSFNIRGVFKPSDQSGVDEPTHGDFRNTAVNATFNSLGSERYLLTEDNKTLRDIAAHAPYDAVVLMVNHERYGGGGIYNFYCTFTTDNQWSRYLLIHEFGHSFAGLADEYYTSSVAYNDFYPAGVEPTNPNITALLNLDSLKWRELVTPGIPIPTPWNKEKYDTMDLEYQSVRQDLNGQIAKLKREGAPAEDIGKLEKKSGRLSREHAADMEDFFHNSQYYGKVGAFEGAGYSSEGLYRPMLDCIMFSRNRSFCKVCERAIAQVIRFYSQ